MSVSQTLIHSLTHSLQPHPTLSQPSSSHLQSPHTPAHTLTHLHRRHSQTPKHHRISSSPNTQPVEPGRTSNELRRLLSSSQKSPSPQPLYSQSASILSLHSHTPAHTPPPPPLSNTTNHPLKLQTLSQLSLSARRTNFVAHSLCFFLKSHSTQKKTQPPTILTHTHTHNQPNAQPNQK